MEDNRLSWQQRFGLPPPAADSLEQALSVTREELADPNRLHNDMTTLLERLADAGLLPDALSDPLAAAALGRIAYAAPFLLRRLSGRPSLLETGALENLGAARPVAGGKEEVDGEGRQGVSILPWNFHASSGETVELEESELMIRLRDWKYANFLRFTARDLLGLQDARATCAQISALADAMIGIAFGYGFTRLAGSFGIPLTRTGALAGGAVVGMGKLGGGELNYASDIDLIFIQEGDDTPCRIPGESMAPPPLPAGTAAGDGQGWWEDWQARAARISDGNGNSPPGRGSSDEFHIRLARLTIRLLSASQGSGFGFRVDCDLRPGGSAGFLAAGMGFMEQYYYQHGREWERAAMLKARVVAGEAGLARRFEEMIRPFVYRRYLDYGALEGIALVKHDIDRVNRATLERNLKLGRGGIRENEFLVQALQLLHGGKKPALQVTGHEAALEQLVETGVLSREERDSILGDYWLLRTLENRIQMVEEAQTHLLPADTAGLTRVLHDFQPDFPSRLPQSRERLEAARERIGKRFAELFAGLGAERFPDSESWRHAVTARARPEEVEAVLERVDRIFSHMMKSRMGERCVFKLAGLLAREEVYQRGTRDALPRWLDFIEQIGTRNAIYSLIEAHPPIVPWIGAIFCEGGHHAGRLIRHPEFLETFFALGEDWSSLHEQLEDIVREATDEEEFLLELQSLHSQHTIRALTAYLEQEADGAHTQMLSDLADATVAACTRFAWRMMVRRLGTPQGADEEGVLGFSVLALGKLGSRQMRFDSDLDLIFLHRGEGTTSKGRTHTEFYTRLAQKIGTLLTAPTQFGRLYELDHRLRPFGNKGVLVPSLTAYKNFLMPDEASGAAVWNFQAFTRIRPICGEAALSQELIEAIARAWHGREMPVSSMAGEVWTMLKRLVAEHAPGSSAERESLSLKYAVGGMIGYEFLQQAYFLAATCGTLPAERKMGEESPSHLTSPHWAAPHWTAPPLHERMASMEPDYLEIGKLDERLSFFDPDNPHRFFPRHGRELRAIAERWRFEEVQSLCSRMETRVGQAFQDLTS